MLTVVIGALSDGISAWLSAILRSILLPLFGAQEWRSAVPVLVVSWRILFWTPFRATYMPPIML